MKKLLLILFLSIYSFFAGQNLDWFYYLTQGQGVYSGNFQNSNRVYSIAIDNEENVYMVGSYQENLGVDPNNPTILQLISANGRESDQCYLVKIDKNKNYLWHKTISIGLNSSASIHSIAIDKNGDVIIAGRARGNNINLNPGSSSPILYNTDNYLQSAIFLNKYSKNGDFIFGSFYKGGDWFPKVTLDKDSNIFLAGQYTNYFAGYNTDFDLSNQTFYLSGRHGSAFILKNDKSGNFIDAKFLEGAKINTIQFDNNGDLVLSGNSGTINFNNEITFINPSTGSSAGDYLLKIDKTITPIWFQSLGGQHLFSSLNDSKPFDIDSDNSIIASTGRVSTPIVFPNQTVQVVEPLCRAVLFKIDKNGNYVWHSTVEQTDYSQTIFPKTVSISSDHTINWTVEAHAVSNFRAVGEKIETIVSGSFGNYATLLKLNSNGKLIYNKDKIINHWISRTDKTHNKIYFAGQLSDRDPNPDMLVNGQLPNIPGVFAGAYIQKLDKCFSGTPDGDRFFYTCVSAQKKIKDLHPKTSYSSWYDSPTSTTPLSPETVLTTKKYYAETQDASCPNNPTRLEVDVKVFQNPPKLVVPDFTFCNLQVKKLSDLKINNNQDIEFFDENLLPIYSSTIIIANKKYYVLQGKSYYNYAYCRSDLTEFYVYDTSVPPLALNSQSFCKIDTPKISDIAVSGINLKWYDSQGNILPTTTLLQDQTKYSVSQTSGTCESAKTEITITLNDPNPPTGNASQTFCGAQMPKISDILVTGQNIKWFDAAGNILATTTPLTDGKTYFASQTLNGCESTQKLAVTVSVKNGGIPANDYAIAICNPITSNTKTENLNDYKANLVANPGIYIFEFFDANNQVITDISNVTLNLGANIFNVKISNNLGCFDFVKLTLTLDPKPKLNLPESVEFCNGQSVTLDAGGNGLIAYEWTRTDDPKVISNNQILVVSTPGNFILKVENSFGCQNSTIIKVTQSILAKIIGVQIVNNTATVLLSEPGNFEFSLDQISWQDSNIFTNLKNGNYTVHVRTKSGCIIGSENFSIFNVSNVFTPDSDGKNDTWKISGLENYPGSEIKIFDRFGTPVLDKISTSTFEWDGTFNSRKLPTGNYWYVIKVTDGRLLQGWLLLKNRN